jgi:hypothetical protein
MMDDVAAERRPLALDAQQAFAGIEDQVVSATCEHGPVDVVAVRQCCFCERGLSDRTLLVRRQQDDRIRSGADGLLSA